MIKLNLRIWQVKREINKNKRVLDVLRIPYKNSMNSIENQGKQGIDAIIMKVLASIYLPERPVPSINS